MDSDKLGMYLYGHGYIMNDMRYFKTPSMHIQSRMVDSNTAFVLCIVTHNLVLLLCSYSHSHVQFRPDSDFMRQQVAEQKQRKVSGPVFWWLPHAGMLTCSC